jgi:hypothetical protein
MTDSEYTLIADHLSAAMRILNSHQGELGSEALRLRSFVSLAASTVEKQREPTARRDGWQPSVEPNHL